jgi:hypothetical protein
MRASLGYTEDKTEDWGRPSGRRDTSIQSLREKLASVTQTRFSASRGMNRPVTTLPTPLANGRAGAQGRHERIALDLQCRDRNREGGSGDDPVLFDTLTGPEAVHLHRGAMALHEVQ